MAGLGAQFSDLFHNRKAMYGVAAAAGVGLIVLWRRKSSGGTSAGGSVATTGSASSTDGTYQPYLSSAYPNTYGTDLASALGNIDSQYAASLQQYQQQLTSVQQALGSLQSTGNAPSVPGTTNVSPTYTPPAASSGGSFGGGGVTPSQPAPPANTTVTVPTTPAQPAPQSLLPSGYGWFDTGRETYTADSIARRYGVPVSSLITWNPSLGINSTGSTIIGRDTPVKVRGNAAAFDLAAYKRVNTSFVP
jgi:hypothetical protein